MRTMGTSSRGNSDPGSGSVLRNAAEHRGQHLAALARRPDLARKRDPHAVETIALTQAQLEAEAVDCDHRRLVGLLTRVEARVGHERVGVVPVHVLHDAGRRVGEWIGLGREVVRDRKSTRLNSSHLVISYAVFCLKKKKRTGA